MTANPQKLAPPSDDKRWRIVVTTMRRHGYTQDALIETLHSVQEAFGYLDDEALVFVSNSLRVPPSRVRGVATFYEYFTLKPQGEHTCVVCMGTACYIRGARHILNELESGFGLKAGETTPDNKVSLVVAHCIGACGLAPATVFDGAVHGKAEPKQVSARIKEWQHNAE